MYPHSPGFSDYTAARTRLGGILSVYGYHLATSIFRFVVEQLPKQSKTRIVRREAQVLVVRHKGKGEIFEAKGAVSLDEESRQLVPEIKALLTNLLVALGHLKSRFAAAVTAPLTTSKATLSDPQLAKGLPQPARVVHPRAVAQGQQTFKADVDTDGGTTVLNGLRAGKFHQETDVAPTETLLDHNVAQLGFFRQGAVVLNLDVTDILHVKARLLAVVFHLTAIAVTVFQRVKTVACFEARKARFMTLLQATKKSSKRLSQSAQHLLDAGRIEQAIDFRKAGALLFKVGALIDIGRPLASLLVGGYTLSQGRIVHPAALPKEQVQYVRLLNGGIESVAIGAMHKSERTRSIEPSQQRFARCATFVSPVA